MDKGRTKEVVSLALFPEVVEQEQTHREKAYQLFRRQCLPCFSLVLGAIDCATLYDKDIEKSLRHAFKTKIKDGDLEACIEAFHFFWKKVFPDNLICQDLDIALQFHYANRMVVSKFFVELVKNIDY